LLTTLKEELIKIGAKIVSSSRYGTFQLAEVAVPRDAFDAILSRIERLGLETPISAQNCEKLLDIGVEQAENRRAGRW
jgi:hypothetical protein